MLQVAKTPASIKVSNEKITIEVVMKDKQFRHYHNSHSSTNNEVKASIQSQQLMKLLLLETADKKLNYQKRFTKLALFIAGTSVSTFRALNNRLEKVIGEF